MGVGVGMGTGVGMGVGMGMGMRMGLISGLAIVTTASRTTDVFTPQLRPPSSAYHLRHVLS